MHKQMLSLIPNRGRIHSCEIFGYSTKGIPGLEVVGLGMKGRSIKEKLIYFNKRYQLNLPPRRFVLCVDDQLILSSKENLYRWLELPFLIMYWSMAGVLPIQNLQNCICSGTISATGLIETLPNNFLEDQWLLNLLEEGSQLIIKENQIIHDNCIPLEEIIRLPKL